MKNYTSKLRRIIREQVRRILSESPYRKDRFHIGSYRDWEDFIKNFMPAFKEIYPQLNYVGDSVRTPQTMMLRGYRIEFEALGYGGLEIYVMNPQMDEETFTAFYNSPGMNKIDVEVYEFGQLVRTSDIDIVKPELLSQLIRVHNSFH